MAGTGPLSSENIADLLENLDKALDEAGGRAELYLAGGARMNVARRSKLMDQRSSAGSPGAAMR